MPFSDREARETQARALAIIARVTREAPASRRKPQAARVARLRKALDSRKPPAERLALVRELLPSERGKEQRVVVWAHACALEVNSGGLPMLFERFRRREIGRIDRALESIGARVTRRALANLLARMDDLVEAGSSWRAASEELERSPVARRTKVSRDRYVDEMEQRLLAYCAANLAELAQP